MEQSKGGSTLTCWEADGEGKNERRRSTGKATASMVISWWFVLGIFTAVKYDIQGQSFASNLLGGPDSNNSIFGVWLGIAFQLG